MLCIKLITLSLTRLTTIKLVTNMLAYIKKRSNHGIKYYI